MVHANIENIAGVRLEMGCVEQWKIMSLAITETIYLSKTIGNLSQIPLMMDSETLP